MILHKWKLNFYGIAPILSDYLALKVCFSYSYSTNNTHATNNLIQLFKLLNKHMHIKIIYLFSAAGPTIFGCKCWWNAIQWTYMSTCIWCGTESETYVWRGTVGGLYSYAQRCAIVIMPLHPYSYMLLKSFFFGGDLIRQSLTY